MTKVIYIASRDHSGSTLLDMLLSTHPKICGVGEAQGLINDISRAKQLENSHKKRCLCGSKLDKCPLWSKLNDYINKHKNSGFGPRYAHMMKLIYNEFGEDTVISDSSKYPNALRQILKATKSDNFIDKEEIFAIHLIKDVRSFVTSFKWRNRNKINTVHLWKIYNKWYTENIYMRDFLIRNNINHIRITYEDLCFNTELVTNGICQKAQIDPIPMPINLSKATGHIGTGNPMRIHKVKSKKIIYDYRWFYETKIQLLYYLFAKVRKYNEHVAKEHQIFDCSAKLFEPKN